MHFTVSYQHNNIVRENRLTHVADSYVLLYEDYLRSKMKLLDSLYS